MNLLRELAAAWSSWVLPATLQVTLLALLVLGADLWLRRFAWPRLRLALHLLVLVKLVLPPTLASPVGPMSAMGGWLDDLAGARVGASLGDDGLAIALTATSQSVTPGTVAPAGLDLATPLFVLWLAGVMLLGTAGVVRHRRARIRLLAVATPACSRLQARVAGLAAVLGLARPPRILVVAGISGPAVMGVLKPLLIVPAWLAADPGSRELGHALLHELTHLRRGDLRVAAVAWVLKLAWWFHPLVWWLERRLSLLRELCCDATVAAHLDDDAPGVGTAAYRQTLLASARRLLESDAAPCAGSLGFLRGPGPLLARLEWLARPRIFRPRLERATTLATALVAGVSLLPMGHDADRPAKSGSASSDPLEALALATVRSAAAGERPPGCMRLQYAVQYLAAHSPAASQLPE